MGMTTSGAMATATEMIDQFNRRDYEAMLAAGGGQVDYTEVAFGRRITDREGFLEAMQGWVTAFPDLRGTVISAARDGDLLAYEIRFEGTHNGPLETPMGTIPASGRHLETMNAFFVRMDGERVAEVRDYGDTLTLLAQIGAIPAQGSAVEAPAEASS